MTTFTNLKDRLTGAASAQGARYSGEADRPLRGYAVTMTVYASLVTALAGLGRIVSPSGPAGPAPQRRPRFGGGL